MLIGGTAFRHTRGSWPRGVRRRLWLASVVAFAVGSALVLLPKAFSGGQAPVTFFDLGFDPTGPKEDLLQPGRQVSLAEAAAAVNFGMIQPDHPLASDPTLSEVWVGESGADEIGLRYESGIRAYLSVWPDGRDAAAFYRDLAAGSGAGQYREIQGRPAWAVAADEQSTGFPHWIDDLDRGRGDGVDWDGSPPG